MKRHLADHGSHLWGAEIHSGCKGPCSGKSGLSGQFWHRGEPGLQKSLATAVIQPDSRASSPGLSLASVNQKLAHLVIVFPGVDPAMANQNAIRASVNGIRGPPQPEEQNRIGLGLADAAHCGQLLAKPGRGPGRFVAGVILVWEPAGEPAGQSVEHHRGACRQGYIPGREACRAALWVQWRPAPRLATIRPDRSLRETLRLRPSPPLP